MRKAKPTVPDSAQLRFFPDYCAGTTQKRQCYTEIQAKLQKDIDSFLIYAAVLKVNHNGKRWLFNLAKKAQEALKTLLQEDGCVCDQDLATDSE